MKIEKREYADDLLIVTKEEREVLDEFLRSVGVRLRTTKTNFTEYHIQADNPYKRHLTGKNRDFADSLMTDEMIAVYQR